LERKNPIQIYEIGFKPALEQYGMWDTLRTDHGTEAVLIRFVQESLRDYRRPVREGEALPAPVVQTSSTGNTTAEQPWRQCNQMVTLPLYNAVIAMEDSGEIQLVNDPWKLFCIRHVLGPFLLHRIGYFIRSMSHTKISSKRNRTPADIASKENNSFPLPPDVIPTTEDAVRAYEQHGSLSREFDGEQVDPLAGYPAFRTARESDLNLTPDEVERITLLHSYTQDASELQAKIRRCIQLTEYYRCVIERLE
jgi:hypothetical protein